MADPRPGRSAPPDLTGLDRLVAGAVAAPIRPAPYVELISRRARARHQRRRALAAAVIVAPLLVLAGVWAIARSEVDDSQRVTSDPSRTTASTTTAPVDPIALLDPVRVVGLDVTPIAMAPSPLAARESAATVWTGTELIIWGGTSGDQGDASSPSILDDGAAYDPATDTWRRIADAPIPARARSAAVWTGTEVIIWGGTTGHAGVGGLLDGAAYDPAADTWRRIADAPPGSPGGRGAPPTVNDRSNGMAVWAGGRMVIGGGLTSNGWASTILVYEPATDRWSVTDGGRDVASIVAAGDRVAVLAVDPGGPGSTVLLSWLDPRTGRIEPGPRVPLDGAGGPGPVLVGTVGGVWTGRSLVVAAAGTVNGPSEAEAVSGDQAGLVATISPGEEAWHDRRVLRGDAVLSWPTDVWGMRQPALLAWTGRAAVSQGMAGGVLSRYDPANGEAGIYRINLESGVPCGYDGSQVWTGSEVLVWGGQSCRGDLQGIAQTAAGARIRLGP